MERQFLEPENKRGGGSLSCARMGSHPPLPEGEGWGPPGTIASMLPWRGYISGCLQRRRALPLSEKNCACMAE